MRSVSQPRPIVDPCRTIPIGFGLFAAVAVHPSGLELFWIMRPECDDPEDAGCACSACAPHEQAGPIPSSCSLALSQRPPDRCGEPTLSGNPCRCVVPLGADHCHHHSRISKASA